MNENINVNTSDLVYWFNALRNLPDSQRGRALDAFWAGQLESKAWLVNKLNLHVECSSNIYIFGGWIGVLANLLFQGASFPINRVRSIDIDPWCEAVADDVNKPYEIDGWKFKAITSDMATFSYQSDVFPDIVINTSSEHISQEDYDKWYSNIPSESLIVVQGNNYFSCGEHIRCSSSLEEFKIQNRVLKPLFEGCYETQIYTRYMCIWRK